MKRAMESKIIEVALIFSLLRIFPVFRMYEAYIIPYQIGLFSEAHFQLVDNLITFRFKQPRKKMSAVISLSDKFAIFSITVSDNLSSVLSTPFAFL